MGAVLLLSGLACLSCDKTEYGKPVKPELDIEEVVVVEAAGGIQEIPLVSSYPWSASTNADWFKITKNRGQMKLDEKIVIDVQPNPSSEKREAGLQIRLMDQLTVDIVISQKGR